MSLRLAGNCSITTLLLSGSNGHRASWSLSEVQLASMSTGTAVDELVGTMIACHSCIAGLVYGSLDMYETESCIRCVCALKINKYWGDMIWAFCSR